MSDVFNKSYFGLLTKLVKLIDDAQFKFNFDISTVTVLYYIIGRRMSLLH